VTYLGDEIAAAGLFTELNEIVEWYLVGSEDAYKKLSPSKVLVDDAVAWAADRGDQQLHLGGGRGGREDTLLWFKSRFSPVRYPFHTGRWILDSVAYKELTAARRESLGTDVLEENFFPSYRAPVKAPGVPPPFGGAATTAMTWHAVTPDDAAALGQLLPQID